MKTKLPLLLLLLLFAAQQIRAQGVSPSLYANGLVSGTCVPIREPYIESPCIAGIMKIIARSAYTGGLSDWIMPEQCWGYMPAPTPPEAAQVNCIRPYDRCNTRYCPDKYCEIIKSLIQMKASMLLRAAETYGKDEYIKPGTHYYKAIKQLVIDINAAYDCAGVQRPVIQGGGAMEYIYDHVSSVPIPASVINIFRYEPGFSSFYLNVDGTAKTTLHFAKTRINYPPPFYPNNDTDFQDCPDITRIEARMWLYYVSTVLVDLGYKSFHMGQLYRWGLRDREMCFYQYTTSLLRMIRTYAASKGTFILLTEENYKALKFPNTSTFMFDYDSRALRPREIANPAVCGDFTSGVTPQFNYLLGTPCFPAAYPAVADLGVLKNMVNGGNDWGYTPLHHCYTPYQPYNTYFDFSEGLLNENHNIPSTSLACGGEDGTWGWDDARWFGRELTEACRASWMVKTIPVVRAAHDGFGFMNAPSVLPIKMKEQRDKHLSGLNPTGDGAYLMSDELSVKNNVISSWKPNSSVSVRMIKECANLKGLCGPFLFPKIKRHSRYIFQAGNPDMTTVYTWHMQDPYGNWIPFTYGNQRIFYPSVSGVYTVYLRQDNLGTYTGTPYYGVKTLAFRVYLYQQCCGSTLSRGATGPPYEETYEGDVTPYMEEQTDFTAYDSYIERGEAFHLPEDSLDYEDSLEFADGKPAAPTPPESQVQENQVQESDGLDIYPNPAGSVLFVKGNDNTEQAVTIRIMDATGRMVKSMTNANLSNKPLEVPLSGITPGVYFINIVNEHHSLNVRRKFIKQ